MIPLISLLKSFNSSPCKSGSAGSVVCKIDTLSRAVRISLKRIQRQIISFTFGKLAHKEYDRLDLEQFGNGLAAENFQQFICASDMFS